jgi:putative flippase GtrA
MVTGNLPFQSNSLIGNEGEMERSVGFSEIMSKFDGERFTRFFGLSGLGWCLDLVILTILTAWAGSPPFLANLISSMSAACFVFLVSRRAIFRAAADGSVWLRLSAYLGYTLLLVLAASTLFQMLASLITDLSVAKHLAFSATSIALIAKIGITPPQLALNFCVARYLAERAHG